MGKNLQNLANDLRQISKQIETNIQELSNKVADKLLHDLVYITPVDTSKLLSNWQINFQKPIDGFEAYFPGQYGSTESASSEYAYQAGKIMLSSRGKGESRIFISNLTPYSETRNALGSQNVRKVSPGYVQFCVQNAKDFLKNSKFDILKR